MEVSKEISPVMMGAGSASLLRRRMRRELLRQGLLLVVYGVVVFFVLFALTYPFDRVAEQAVRSLADNMHADVQYSAFDFGLPVRLGFKDLRISSSQGQMIGISEVSFPELQLRVGLLPLLRGRNSVAFNGKIALESDPQLAYAVAGRITTNETEDKQQISISGFSAENSGAAFKLDGNVSINQGKNAGFLPSGEFDLTLTISKFTNPSSTNKNLAYLYQRVSSELGPNPSLPATYTIQGPLLAPTIQLIKN